MADKMGLSEKHPRAKIFKVTDCLNVFRCCIPDCILSGRLDWFNSEPEDERGPYEAVSESQDPKTKYYPFIEEEVVLPYSNH